MKLEKVIANKTSGVYQPPLTVELDCPSVNVAPEAVSVDTPIDCYSRNICKINDTLFFNAQSLNGTTGYLGIYHIPTNTFSTKTCPYDTFNANFINVNYDIYIIGGRDAVSNRPHTKIMRHKNDEIETMAAELPVALRDTSCCAIGTDIYIVGGHTGHVRVSSIYVYNTITDKISEFSVPLNIACFNSACCLYQNRYIYIIDGAPGTNKIQIIDTVDKTVVNMSKDLPFSRIGAGAMIKEDFLYVFGGYDNAYRNTVYKKYILDDSDWVLDTQSLLLERGYFGYTSDEKGYYHIIGGTDTRSYETGRFGIASSLVEIRYNHTTDGTEPAEPIEVITEEETGVFQNISFPPHTVCIDINCELVVYDDKIYMPQSDRGVCIYSLKNQTINTIESGTFYGLIYLGGDYLYAFGHRAGVHNIYKINLKTNTTVTTLTNPVGEFLPDYSYTSIGNVGYIAAGQSLYKLENDVITLIEGVSIPININRGYVVSDKKKYLYMVSKTSTICYRYNTETKEFAQLPDIPYTREAPALNVVGDYLYYIGGRVGDRGSNMFIKLNLLNPQTWERETSLPTNGAYINSCVYENYIYSFTEAYGTYYPRQFWKYLPIEQQVKKTRTGNIYTSPIELTSPTKHKIKAKAFYTGV